MMDINKKNSMIFSHQMCSQFPCGEAAAAQATLQLMGAGLASGEMDAQDCVDIISAVFNKKHHEEIMAKVDRMISSSPDGNIDSLLDEIFGSMM